MIQHLNSFVLRNQNVITKILMILFCCFGIILYRKRNEINHIYLEYRYNVRNENQDRQQYMHRLQES